MICTLLWNVQSWNCTLHGIWSMQYTSTFVLIFKYMNICAEYYEGTDHSTSLEFLELVNPNSCHLITVAVWVHAGVAGVERVQEESIGV